jgi:hypothetical protein
MSPASSTDSIKPITFNQGVGGAGIRADAPQRTPMRNIFENYNAALCRNLRGEKLRRILSAHCHDGTEVHGAVDHALPGIENTTAVKMIKAAVESQYANSISIDTVIDLFDDVS